MKKLDLPSLEGVAPEVRYYVSALEDKINELIVEVEKLQKNET